MRQTNTYCDHCGKLLTYTDADGDKETNGITIKIGKKININAVSGFLLEATSHIRTSSGSIHPGLHSVSGEIYCSPDCVDAVFASWLTAIRNSWREPYGP